MSLAATAERKCPIISLASTKGGVGKTTLAHVLATEVARRLTVSVPPWRGLVICVDADPNRTLAQVLRLTGDPAIACIESDSDRLLSDLREARRAAGRVVICLQGAAQQAH